jgi:alpha-tubulin suppressor-like RCC1 family protein
VRGTRTPLVATLLALVLALAACSDGSVDPVPDPPTGPAAVATVRVRASAPQVGPGDSLTLSAEPLDARGTPVGDAPVAWQWADSTAFLGTAEGNVLRVRALRAAVVTVTAQSGTARGTFELTIRYTGPAGLRFIVVPRDSLIVGAQPSVSALAVDSAGRLIPGSVAVTSSDTTVASVRIAGGGPMITALRPGRTEIVATLGALRLAMPVQVWPPPRYLFPDTSALLPGITRTLRPQELPENGRATLVAAEAWRSSAPEVATVSATGVVTAVAPGRATISAVSAGDTLRAVVVVKAPAAPVEYVAVVPRAACAIARDGAMYCWGDNQYGQLGTDEVMDRCESFQQNSGGGRSWTVRSTFRCSALPVRVQSASRFRSASGHETGVCGVTENEALECWGFVPTAARTSPVPVPVPVAPGVRAAAVDGRCLLTVEGQLHCWGGWTVPIFEDGSRTSETLQRVPSPVAFRQLSAGGYHLCGVTAEDVVYCWGSALGGAVGVPGSVQAPGCFVACEPRPRRVEGLPPTRQVRVTEASSCALDLQGVVRCWGTAFENGRREVSATPAPIPDAPPFATLVGGGYTPCGLTSEGAIWCWGGLFHRPNGSQVLSSERATRAGPELPLRAASMGIGVGCGIATDGLLHCFAQGPLLGDGEYDARVNGWRVVRVAGQR